MPGSNLGPDTALSFGKISLSLQVNKDMSVILHIESATDGCSVAVSDEGQLVFDKADREGHNNAVSGCNS